MWSLPDHVFIQTKICKSIALSTWHDTDFQTTPPKPLTSGQIFPLYCSGIPSVSPVVLQKNKADSDCGAFYGSVFFQMRPHIHEDYNSSAIFIWCRENTGNQTSDGLALTNQMIRLDAWNQLWRSVESRSTSYKFVCLVCSCVDRQMEIRSKWRTIRSK